MRKQTKYNYVKIENKEYGIFIETLMKLKEQEKVGNENEKIVPVIMVNEYADILLENHLKYIDTNHDINIIRFHVRNYPLLEYGLQIDSDIFVYRENIVCEEDINNIIVVESIQMVRTLSDDEYRDLYSYVKSTVFKNLDEDINNINFPLYILYEATCPEFQKNENMRQKILGFDSISYIKNIRIPIFGDIDNYVNESYDIKNSSGERVENVEMTDIEDKLQRTLDELKLYKPSKQELDISTLIAKADTLELLEIPETFIITVYDQMKHALLNTMIELQRIKIIVKNQ